jgi:diamine N-acetyltransferase
MWNKADPPVLEGSRLRLRPLSASDLRMTLAWRNRYDIRKSFFHSDIITMESHISWFERYSHREDDYVFIIEERTSGRPIGQLSLYHIDFYGHCAEFGRLMIGEDDARGLGHAKEATAMLVRAGFDDMGMVEIYLEVYAQNSAAIAVYKSCGFVVDRQKDGVLKMIKKHNR